MRLLAFSFGHRFAVVEGDHGGPLRAPCLVGQVGHMSALIILDLDIGEIAIANAPLA